MNENENSKLNNNLVKINLSLNRDQVNEIDVLSRQTKASRSGFIRQIVDLFLNDIYDDDYLLNLQIDHARYIKKRDRDKLVTFLGFPSLRNSNGLGKKIYNINILLTHLHTRFHIVLVLYLFLYTNIFVSRSYGMESLDVSFPRTSWHRTFHGLCLLQEHLHFF